MDCELFYRVDAQDRIIETGGAWDRFAQENAGNKLLGSEVIGQPLYEFISGDVSRMFVRTLIDGVRLLRRQRTVPYRCDSPGLRRFMEMTISLEADASVLLVHRALRVEPVSRQFDFQTVGQQKPKMVVRCSHCNSVKHQGVWGEPEVLLPEDKSRVPVIYGVCERCLNAVRRS